MFHFSMSLYSPIFESYLLLFTILNDLIVHFIAIEYALNRYFFCSGNTLTFTALLNTHRGIFFISGLL
jgi:hypothetical protein